MWSFVGSKKNQQWVWLAPDVDSREIVGVFIGDASRQSFANALDNQLRSFGNPYQQFTASARFATPIFGRLINRCYRVSAIEQLGKKPAKRVTQSRFNNTLRQRVGRLVRKTLSFSKKLSNHIGAIWYFVHYYNASLRF